jgi:hypothetical protein
LRDIPASFHWQSRIHAMASPEISSNKMPAHTTLVFIGSRFLGLGENNAPAGAARRPPEADAGLAGALDPHIGARSVAP